MAKKKRVKLNREERASRRKQIVEYVKKGHTIALTARAYGVSQSLVKQALKEANEISPQQRMSVNTFAILKALLDGSTQSEVAAHTGLTRARISAIACMAREGGFDV